MNTLTQTSIDESERTGTQQQRKQEDSMARVSYTDTRDKSKQAVGTRRRANEEDIYVRHNSAEVMTSRMTN